MLFNEARHSEKVKVIDKLSAYCPYLWVVVILYGKKNIKMYLKASSPRANTDYQLVERWLTISCSVTDVVRVGNIAV